MVWLPANWNMYAFDVGVDADDGGAGLSGLGFDLGPRDERIEEDVQPRHVNDAARHRIDPDIRQL